MALSFKDIAAPQPLYYQLTPIFPAKLRSIATAAVVTCIATGKQLHHSGGGADALSVEVVHALDARQHDGKASVIVDAEDWDNLRGCLDKLRRQIENGFPAALENEDLCFTLEAAEQLVERTEDKK